MVGDGSTRWRLLRLARVGGRSSSVIVSCQNGALILCLLLASLHVGKSRIAGQAPREEVFVFVPCAVHNRWTVSFSVEMEHLISTFAWLR